MGACETTAIFTRDTGKLPDWGTLTYFPPLSEPQTDFLNDKPRD